MLSRLLLLFILTGCASETIVTPVIQPNSPVAVQTAQPMTLNSVHWQVLSLAELKALVSKLQLAQQTNAVVFLLSPQEYTNLMLNFVEIERYLKEQQAILNMLTTIINSRSEKTDQQTH